MRQDLKEIFEQFVDYLMPTLTPYEASLYIFLLRNSHIKNNVSEIRIGKRTIAGKISSVRGLTTNYDQVTKLVKGLEKKGCIKIGDTNHDGTLYNILLPVEIPSVKEKLTVTNIPTEEDCFTDPKKREAIFKEDGFTCFYCGEKVTTKNATLDHLIPQFKSGKNTKENLKICCLVCNSIKSGKTYEEAALFYLKVFKKEEGEYMPMRQYAIAFWGSLC